MVEILLKFVSKIKKYNELVKKDISMSNSDQEKVVSQIRDLDGKNYYKISKSNLGISKLCSEVHFIEYPEDSIVRDKGSHYICFVPAECVIFCVHYGDQLTEIKFNSKDCRFREIEYEEAFYGGMIWHEYNAKAVITGKNYSLAEPETIQMIVDMASSENLIKAVNMEATENISISNHLKKLGFNESLDRWELIKSEVKNHW